MIRVPGYLHNYHPPELYGMAKKHQEACRHDISASYCRMELARCYALVIRKAGIRYVYHALLRVPVLCSLYNNHGGFFSGSQDKKQDFDS
jgi:hypothetical protein